MLLLSLPSRLALPSPVQPQKTEILHNGMVMQTSRNDILANDTQHWDRTLR